MDRDESGCMRIGIQIDKGQMACITFAHRRPDCTACVRTYYIAMLYVLPDDICMCLLYCLAAVFVIFCTYGRTVRANCAAIYITESIFATLVIAPSLGVAIWWAVFRNIPLMYCRPPAAM